MCFHLSGGRDGWALGPLLHLVAFWPGTAPLGCWPQVPRAWSHPAHSRFPLALAEPACYPPSPLLPGLHFLLLFHFFLFGLFSSVSLGLKRILWCCIFSHFDVSEFYLVGRKIEGHTCKSNLHCTAQLGSFKSQKGTEVAERKNSHGHLKGSNPPCSKGIEGWQIEAHSDIGDQMIITVFFQSWLCDHICSVALATKIRGKKCYYVSQTNLIENSWEHWRFVRNWFKLWISIMNHIAAKYLNSFVWWLGNLQMLFRCLKATWTNPF